MHIKSDALKSYPGLKVAVYIISGVNIPFSYKSNMINTMFNQVVEYLKESNGYFSAPIIREYHKWATKSCGEESKIEELVKQIMMDKYVFSHPILDMINITQVYDGTIMGAYDVDKLNGEPFIDLKEVEQDNLINKYALVLSDDSNVLSYLPCRDEKYALVDDNTKNYLLVAIGNKHTSRAHLINTLDSLAKRIKSEFGGSITSMMFLD